MVITSLRLVEIATIAQICIIVEIQNPLCRHIVGIVVSVVVVEVQEHRTQRATVRCGGEAYTPDNLGCKVIVPHIVEVRHIRCVEARRRRE